jgi:hypothetical protein
MKTKAGVAGVVIGALLATGGVGGLFSSTTNPSGATGDGLVLAWDALAGGTQTHWLWLSLRWGAGIIGPLIVAAMTWRILKYRNTQSATGVLFVGVILTFLGEMTALLLYRELGLPL